MISILLPIYNGIEFIDECVSSIHYQSFKNWELIIGINGHSENSPIYQKAKEFEEKDRRIKVYDLYTIKGKSNALNEMIKYCQYDWISLIDVDDTWLFNKLESQIPYMKTYDIIGTHCQYFGDRSGQPAIPLGDLKNHNFFTLNPIVNSSCLIKKNLAYWGKEWDGVEDYDLWLKLWKAGKKFYNVESIQTLHRIHQESAFNAQGNNLKVDNLLKKYGRTSISQDSVKENSCLHTMPIFH